LQFFLIVILSQHFALVWLQLVEVLHLSYVSVVDVGDEEAVVDPLPEY